VLDTTGYENWYFASRAYELPTLIADMAILFAAYSFNTVGLLAVRPRAAASSLDIVLYAATMVSNPEPIDPALDEVRLITSRAASDTAVRLSAEDQKKLCRVYLQIEEYLTTKEPLRSFNKADLRSSVAEHFGLSSTSTDTFWPQLPA
jgi:hypothetical protein